MNIILRKNDGKQFAEDVYGNLYEVYKIENVNYLPSKGENKAIYIVNDKSYYCGVINIKQVNFKTENIETDKKQRNKKVKEEVNIESNTED